jgi:hypothetical protein
MHSTLPAILVFVIGALLSIVFGVEPVSAACTSTSQCPSDMTCQNSAIPGIRECKQQLCNANSDCPSARPTCQAGACRAASGGGGTGGGIPQSDVGQPCGQVRIGQVTKNVGCKPNLQCVRGRCVRPPS